jgi:hypothetical protein
MNAYSTQADGEINLSASMDDSTSVANSKNSLKTGANFS